MRQPDSKKTIQNSTLRQHLKDIVDALPGLPPGEALRLIADYDLKHRIAWDVPADPSLLNRTVLRAFDAYRHGDRSVDLYDLFRAISDALNRRKDPAYWGEPLTWYSRTLTAWHRQFRYGAPLEPLSERDALQRASILLTEDLRALEPRPAAYKARLRACLAGK